MLTFLCPKEQYGISVPRNSMSKSWPTFSAFHVSSLKYVLCLSSAVLVIS